MPPWFHKGPSPFHTPLAMIGAKPGGRILFIGAGDPDVAAQIALITGLNGVTCVTDDEPGAEAVVNTAAVAAGALVEFNATLPPAPPDDGLAFDAAVIIRLGTRGTAAQKAAVTAGLARLRAGGRLLVLEGTRRSGFMAALRPKTPMLPEAEVLARLQQAGAIAARSLGEADGVRYYECRRG